MYTFSFLLPINLSSEGKKGKWLLAVTSSGALNIVFRITDENNSLSISTPGHWGPSLEESDTPEETSERLNEFL